MNTIEQQTFIDQLRNAENALGDLASYADNLANRLVGYADEPSEGYPESMPSSGFLLGVGETAGRMERKVSEVRRCLSRINQALPVESISKMASAQGAIGTGGNSKAAW